MSFTIITHVEHKFYQNTYWAYAPYVREMNLWGQLVNKVNIVAPTSSESLGVLDLNYQHKFIQFTKVPAFNIQSIYNTIKTIVILPLVFYRVFKAIRQADHLHIRCPGNLGLIACIVQIFFPTKTKTAKYAGNWDAKSVQPISYKLQKWILANPLLSKNIQVLVYGHWPNQSKNIKPFFAASYHFNEINSAYTKPVFSANHPIKCLFVGTLTTGKQPLYAIKIIEQLNQIGYNISLNLIGEGVLRLNLEQYIKNNKLLNYITLSGGLDKETLKKLYQTSHFLILPSISEGWPKAVAEAMFWGCVPIANQVSCLPMMLDNGQRGILTNGIITDDLNKIIKVILDPHTFYSMSRKGIEWSQQFTIDHFFENLKIIFKTSKIL